MIPRALGALLALATLAAGPALASGDLPTIRANPNTRAAGRLARDTLMLRLVATAGRWFPEAEGGASVVVQAFSEEGRAPSIPGPLVRVRAGTTLVITVRNALPVAVVVHGLAPRPQAADEPVTIVPGTSRTLRFEAGAPGTYFYWATTTDRPPDDREGVDGQLSGAFIVDPPGGPARADRVFVMGAWSEPVDTVSVPQVWREALVINGRTWPHTERLAFSQGDTVEWRWINANDRGHPMHLHGFYYQVLSQGDARGDTVRAPGARPLVVTQRMLPWSTMRMTFVPHTAGNWVFHCHILFHIETAGLLPHGTADRHETSAAHGMDDMRGLVLGFTVRPAATEAAPPADEPRRLRLLAQARPRVFGDSMGFGFVLQDGAEPARDSVAIPGTPIVLTRGATAWITVVNRLPEPTAVHWHGIELVSYFDGVAGISGLGQRLAPSIMPGDSFTAQLRPPRAGTFIYHTHFNDVTQASRGLYGPLIVLEPGERYDPATDHVWLHSQTPLLDDGPALFNGRASGHAPIEMRAGVTNRIRLIGFPAGPARTFALLGGDTLATWRALAKDGADLPPALRAERPARQRVTVGETWDFAFVPQPGDTLRVELRSDTAVLLTVPVVVR